MGNFAKIFAFLLLITPAFAGQHQVVKVVDGDTIDVIYEGKVERVRFICVDTPESVHPIKSKNTQMGRDASEYTKQRLSGKKVDLEFEAKKRGWRERLLAYVIVPVSSTARGASLHIIIFFVREEYMYNLDCIT
ncbi:MAG: thermonuclease family protein [Desulfobacter sp.]